MTENLSPWDPCVNITPWNSIKVDDLEITFHRSIRVPDNDSTKALPPSLGHFPLFRTRDYAHRLPASMAQKGGVFIPMYQREAMWINFRSHGKYVIKLYVGNVNAISGEQAVLTPGAALRCRNLLLQGKSIQDYVAVPDQKWLDCAAIEPGKFRPFVAAPIRFGHPVDGSTTSDETIGGLQFEVTKLDIVRHSSDAIDVHISTSKTRYTIRTSKLDPLYRLFEFMYNKQGMPPFGGKFIFDKEPVEFHLSFEEHGIDNGDTIEFHEDLVVGGCPEMKLEPGINPAPRGLVKQGIAQIPKSKFQKTVPVAFNVQILNSVSFQMVTGAAPPPSPVSAATYTQYGFPFSPLYEEPIGMVGDFSGVRSVTQIDGGAEGALFPIPVVNFGTGLSLANWKCSICEMENSAAFHQCGFCFTSNPGLNQTRNPFDEGLINPQGSKGKFMFSWEMAEELRIKATVF